MNPLTILVLAAATWRISSFLVNEDGPFFVFERLRERFGIHYQYINGKEIKVVPLNFMAQLLDCVWCASMYIGTGWTILFVTFPNLALWFALPFALSAFSVVVEEKIRRN